MRGLGIREASTHTAPSPCAQGDLLVGMEMLTQEAGLKAVNGSNLTGVLKTAVASPRVLSTQNNEDADSQALVRPSVEPAAGTVNGCWLISSWRKSCGTPRLLLLE